MNPSLLKRLVGAMWLLSALSCLSAAVLATAVILENAEQQAKNRIQSEEANLIALGLIDLISLNEFKELVPRLPDTLHGDRLNEIIRIYEPPGNLLYTNVRSADIAKANINRAKHVNKDFYVIEGAHKQYLALVQSHRASDGDVLWIEIITPRTTPAAVLRQIAVPFSIALSALLVLSFFIAWRVTRRALDPLRGIATHMDQLDVAHFKSWESFPVTNQPKEFRSIVVKVNELVIRMQNAFLRFHQLGQFIAHEVRTPLTVMQGEIETTLADPTTQKGNYQEALKSCLHEVGRIDGIVETVLRFSAREQAAKPFSPEAINVRKWLDEIVPKLEHDSGRTIITSVELEAKTQIFADRELLTLLMSNLIRNVSKHTPAELKPEIHLQPADSNQIIIEVRDRGPGLPREMLEALNSDTLIVGSLGIGLNLCRQIASVSRMKLEFENRPEGGLTVRFYCSLSDRPT